MKSYKNDFDKQDDYFKSNISNLVKFVQNRNFAKFSSFLDIRQIQLAKEILRHEQHDNYLLFGGAKNCERSMLGIFPENQEVDKTAFPITALKLNYDNRHNSISHRDCLGALMGLQLKRETIGDIAVNDDFTVIFVCDEIAEFVRLNLDKIGQACVTIEVLDSVQINCEQKYELINSTVASLRLDCVIASILNKSRGIVADVIASKAVKVNEQEIQNLSKSINAGDIITIRGKGKFIIDEEIKKTKKDRYFITIKKLV